MSSTKGRYCRGFFPVPALNWRYSPVESRLGRVENRDHRRADQSLTGCGLHGGESRGSRPRHADFTLHDPELDDRSFRNAEEGRAMFDSRKFDLIGRERKSASDAVALTLWAPTGGIVAGWWRRFAKDFARPYRPEQHYMRGPGPKWREKHGPDAR